MKPPLTYLACGPGVFTPAPDVQCLVKSDPSFASASQGRDEREGAGVTKSAVTAQTSLKSDGTFCLTDTLGTSGMVNGMVSHSESGNGKC